MPSLADLEPGQRATVRAVHGSGAEFQRLLELGLVTGTAIALVRRAPLGDPLEIRLHDYNLSLRAAEAALVEVEHD